MGKTSAVRIGLVLGAWASVGASTAMAQFAPPPPAQPPSLSPMAIMANPYMNPYMNPSLYPGSNAQQMSGANALLFMYAAQSANGGIGSGRLSGTRPDPTASTSARRARAAEMPVSSTVPGGGAARFFNPGPTRSAGSSRYYNQRGRHFMNNGR